jgi:hypothetical protein
MTLGSAVGGRVCQGERTLHPVCKVCSGEPTLQPIYEGVLLTMALGRYLQDQWGMLEKYL